jgi:hypothetical protein
LRLAEAGFDVPRTVIICNRDATKLSELLPRHPWNVAVIKPSVSANAFETALVTWDSIDAAGAQLERMRFDSKPRAGSILSAMGIFRQLTEQFLANRPDVQMRPYRSRRCPPGQDAACHAGRSSADDQGRRCSHPGFRHQWPGYP